MNSTGLELQRLFPEERKEKYRNYALAIIDNGRRTYSKWYTSLQGWYELYRGYWRGTGDSAYNNIHIPALFSLIQTFIARIHAVLFSELPYVAFVPTGPEDAKKARKNERLTTEQMELSNIRIEGLRFLLQSAMYGVGIAQVGWKKQYGPISRSVGQVNGRALRIRGRRANSTILKADWPDVVNVDGTDFVPDVGIQDVPKMLGCGRRYYQTYDAIVAGAHEGPGGEPPIYDPIEVERMGSSKPGKGLDADTALRRSLAAGVDEKTWAQLSTGERNVECYDVYLTVPQELGLWWSPETGQWDTEEFPTAEYTTEVLVTLADRAFVLRAIPNPFWTQEKPFLVHRPLEDAHYFHAPGFLEVGLKSQVATNRLVNTQLDAYDMMANPPWVADITRIDPRRIRNGPGHIIPGEGPVGEDVLRQLTPNLQGIRDIFPQTGYLWGIMQQTFGLPEDAGMGTPISKRQTRAEYIGREGAVGVRIGLSASLAEAQFMEPLAKWFFELNRQFLDFASAVDLIGANAILDPLTFTFIPQEPVGITDQDLAADFDIRCMGAARTIGKAARQQNMLALLQALPAILPWIPTFNGWAFGRELMSTMEIRDLDAMLGTAEQAEQAALLAQALGQKGLTNGRQSGQAGEAGGPPEQPIVGALGGAPGGNAAAIS